MPNYILNLESIKMEENQQLQIADTLSLALFAFGIQFVNSLILANMSTIYLFLKAPGSLLPLLGLVAPISGLIIQPLVGQLSDITNTRLGKRYPYIIGWTVLAFLACIFFYFVNTLFWAVILIGIISCSINGAIESLRALTGDLVPDRQKASAFAWQTIFAGVSAGSAVFLTFILSKKINGIFQDIGVPISLKLAFLIGGVVWFIILLTTYKRTCTLINHSEISCIQPEKSSNPSLISKVMSEFFINIKSVPKPLLNFGVIQMFTWMGMFTFWLYFSADLAQQFYGFGHSHIASAAYKESILEQASLNTNFYFGIYQFVSVLFALVIPILLKYMLPKKLHGLSLMIGAVGILMTSFASNQQWLIFSMICVGVLWGSVMTLPYSIISTGLSKNKMGTYLGLFNISITVPQILAGFALRPIYIYIFDHKAIHIILFGGVLILLSAFLTLFYDTEKSIWQSLVDIWRQNLIPKLRYFYVHLTTVQASQYQKFVINARYKHILVTFIILLMTLGQLTITIYLPSMPSMVKMFGTGHSAIQLSLTLYLIGYGISQFFYGPLSDVYGRRNIILVGLLIYMLGSIICVCASNITFFLVARIIQGMGIGCGDTMGRAILCDRFQKRDFIKAASSIGMAATITPFIGPLIGGYIEQYFNWRVSFVLMLIYSLVILILIFYYLPESKRPDHFMLFKPKDIMGHYYNILRNYIFIGFFIPGLVCFVGEILYNIVSPFLIQQQLGYHAIAFGWLTLFTISGLLIGTLIARGASHLIKYDDMVYLGMLVLIFASICMVIPGLFHYLSIYSVILPMTIFMVGVGMIYPNTNMGALTPFASNAGFAGALQGGLQMLTGGIIATHMSTLSVKTVLPLGCFLLVLSIIGFIMFYLLIIKMRQNSVPVLMQQS